MLEISEVRIKKVERGKSLKAIASITIDNAFVIHDVKVIEGKNGLFLAMPSRKSRDGGFWDVGHPINKEARKMFQDAVIEKYNSL